MAAVRARSLYSGPQSTVTAMELFELRIDRTTRGYLAAGSLKPIAVIVRERDRIYALDMAGRPVDVRRPRARQGDL